MATTAELRLARTAVQHRRRLDLAGVALWCFSGLVFAFLLAPLVILLLTSFTASATVEFPPAGLSLRWYQTLWRTLLGASGTRGGLTSSLQVSVGLGLLTAALAVIAGVLAAYALHKYRFRGKTIFNNLFLLPLTFPQLVIGVALLLMFSELKLFDRFTRLVIGHAVISLPYVILTVTASLKVYEEQVEEAARSLGAGPVQTFWYITLPLIRPGIIAGAVFAFITSFTQFTISFFLSFGRTIPLPMWLYDFISHGHDPLLASISVFLIAMTFIVALALERLVGLYRIFGR
jgi:putative spermidine/putrescine transport system permease protein